MIYALTGLLIFALSGVVASCNKEVPTEPTEDFEAIQRQLLGEWYEVLPCYPCKRRYTFTSEKEIIEQPNCDDCTFLYKYTFIDSTTLRISREWDIEADRKVTDNLLVFITSDTLVIHDFLANEFDIEIDEFRDVTMVKVHDKHE